MKNHRFLWLRNRTTDNRKCEKARNIKEKRTIEMFNTVSNLLVVHHSSQNDNFLGRDFQKNYQTPCKRCVCRGFCIFNKNVYTRLIYQFIELIYENM